MPTDDPVDSSLAEADADLEAAEGPEAASGDTVTTDDDLGGADADFKTVECRGCGATNALSPRSTRMTCRACGVSWAWVRCTRFRCHKVTAVPVGEAEPTCRYCKRMIKLNWPALHHNYQRRLADGIEQAPPGARLVLGLYWLHPDAFGSEREVPLGEAEYTGGHPGHEDTGAVGALVLAPTGVRFTPFGDNAFAGWRDVDALALEDDGPGSQLKVRTEVGDVVTFRTPARIPGKARRKLTAIDAQLREKAHVLHRLAMGPPDLAAALEREAREGSDTDDGGSGAGDVVGGEGDGADPGADPGAAADDPA